MAPTSLRIKSSSPISDLPNEIIIEILAKIDPGELHLLANTCKTFRRILKENRIAIYRSIERTRYSVTKILFGDSRLRLPWQKANLNALVAEIERGIIARRMRISEVG